MNSLLPLTPTVFGETPHITYNYLKLNILFLKAAPVSGFWGLAGLALCKTDQIN